MNTKASKKQIIRILGSSMINSNKPRFTSFLKVKAAKAKLAKSISKSLIPKRILNEGIFRIA